MKKSRSSSQLSAIERRASISLASIFSLRMLGIFMILPVFTLQAHQYRGDTALLTGIAIGIYGLSQALLQIPFGMLSDRIGRKTVITAGLLLFAAGGALAALAHSIMWVIAGRALQGAGAVASAIMALAADLTREENRTKAMATIGSSIGLAFAAALIIGPFLSHHIGLSGIFWLTTVLALAAIAVLHLYVPKAKQLRFHRDAETAPAQLARVLRDSQLLRLDGGILFLHMMLTATFVAMPLVLRDDLGIPTRHQWWVYLGVMAVAVALMVPAVIYADRTNRLKRVFVAAVVLLLLGQAGMFFTTSSAVALALLLAVFFTGFNILEATLPSLISRVSPATMKGTALGAYSTSQYLGAFIGGVSGGWILGHYGPHAVFALCTAVCVLWLLVAAGMRNPPRVATQLLNVGMLDANTARQLNERLTGVRGVVEAVVIPEDGVAYLKVDRSELDAEALAALAPAPG